MLVSDPKFTETHLKVVTFCAAECARQKSGELSVANMVNAWDCAATFDNWNVELVLELGFHIEPEKNRYGFRQMPVTIDGEPIPHETIAANVESLMRNFDLEHIDNMGGGKNDRLKLAEEFYQAFEQIHPFIDGNGRVGAILFNMILDYLDDPMNPPMFRR